MEDRTVEADVDGHAQMLTRLLGSAELKGKYRESLKDVLSKYPNADRLHINERFMYVMCQSIFSDPSLTEAEKRQQFMHVQSQLTGPNQSGDESGKYPRGKIAALFQSDMLGAELTYIETITGPARRVMKIRDFEARFYQVDGCRVTAWTRAGAALGYSLDLNTKCDFPLSNFLNTETANAGSLTVGQFVNGPFGGSAEVRSTCIYMCGNAADPTVNFVWEGPHAANFLDIVLTVTIASNPTVNAASNWSKAMRRQDGEDYVENTKFNCSPRWDDFAVSTFSQFKPDQITVGFIPDEAIYRRSCATKKY